MSELLFERFVDTMTYTGKNVKQILSDLKEIKTKPPSKIKVGDVFVAYEGKKKRPCVVVKVLSCDTVMYMPLTSTENCHNLYPYNSRFFGEGWFCKNVNVASFQLVLDNFVGVLDSPKAIKNATLKMKEFINTNL